LYLAFDLSLALHPSQLGDSPKRQPTVIVTYHHLLRREQRDKAEHHKDKNDLRLVVSLADCNRHDCVHGLATLYHGRETFGLPIQTASLDLAAPGMGRGALFG
jgi:hypothetical protein